MRSLKLRLWRQKKIWVLKSQIRASFVFNVYYMTVVRVGVYVGVGVLPGAPRCECGGIPCGGRPAVVTSAAIASPSADVLCRHCLHRSHVRRCCRASCSRSNDLEDDAPPSSIASGDSTHQRLELWSRRVLVRTCERATSSYQRAWTQSPPARLRQMTSWTGWAQAEIHA